MSDTTGILFVLLSEVLLAVVNAIVKIVKSWPVDHIMAVRYLLDLVLCLGMCAACRFPLPSSKVAARLLVRGMAYCAFIAFLWGGLRSCLPIGDTMVVVVAVSPICLVGLTWALLGEQIPRTWPLQVALCVSGALLVNKPMAPRDECSATATLWPLGAAFFGACMNFMSRNVKEVPPAVVMASNDLVALVFSLAVMLLNSNGSELSNFAGLQGLDWDFLLIAAAAVLGWVGLMCNVKGYQSVSVAAVASIAGYAAVPLGYMLQVVVFGEVPDVLSVAGAVLIVGTNVGVSVSKYHAAKGSKAVPKEEQSTGYQPLPGSDTTDDKVLGA